MSVRYLKQDDGPEPDPIALRRARRRSIYAEALADDYLRRRLRAAQRAERERTKADPERHEKRKASKRAYAARERARERTDAERAAERERNRVHYLQARERQGKPVGATAKRTTKAVIKKTRIPAEPFRKWLFAYGEWIGDTTAETIGPELGLPVRRVYAYMYEAQPAVVVEAVDRAILACPRELVVDGRTIYEIGDLYPELFQDAA